MGPPVSKRSRLLDAASVLLFVVGALCYGVAYDGMQSLRVAAHDPNAPLFAGYTRYVRLLQLSYAGLIAIGAGLLVALYAALHARRAARIDGSARAG